MIKLEPGKAAYPMPPHRRIVSVDIARRDPHAHPDAAFAAVLDVGPKQLRSHKKWVTEDGGDIPGSPQYCAFDPASTTVEFYPIPDREYFARIIRIASTT